MKFHLLSIVLVLIFLSFAGFGQKIDYDKKTQFITIDGVNAFMMEKEGCGFADANCYYNVSDTTGHRLFRVYYRDFKSSVEISRANPQGIVRYIEFVFTETKQKAEVEFPGVKCEKIGKVIVKNQLIKDGKLDPKAVDDFVFTSGTPFSDRAQY